MGWLAGILATLLVPLLCADAAFAQRVRIEPGMRCALKRGAKLSTRPRGRGKKTPIASGTQVEIASMGRGWALIEGGAGERGYLRARLLGGCEPAADMAGSAVAASGSSAMADGPASESTVADNDAADASSTALDPTSTATVTEHAEPASTRKRRSSRSGKSSYQLEGRYRYLIIPNQLLGMFFSLYRPVQGVSYAAVASYAKRSGFNLMLSVDVGALWATEGPWDDRDEEDDDPDWTRIYLRLWSADLTAAYEFKLFGGFSILVGAGLGAVYIDGYVLTFDSPKGPRGDKEYKDIPRVLPVLNVQVAPRLVIADTFVIQLEAGFRNALYAGVSAGLRL